MNYYVLRESYCAAKGDGKAEALPYHRARGWDEVIASQFRWTSKSVEW